MQSGPADRIEIHSGVLTGVAAYAEQQGLDLVPLFKDAGLREDCSRFDTFISMESFARLLELAAKATGDDAFGLKVAAAADHRAMGAVDYAVTNAATLRDCLMTLVRYISTVADLTRLEFVIDGDQALLEWMMSPLIVQRSQYIDYVAMALTKMFCELIGSSWRPMIVSLERPQPQQPAVHRKYLGPNVTFARDVNAIGFATSSLDFPIQDADPYLHRLAVRLCERELEERLAPREFTSRLHDEIATLLSNEGRAQIEMVARRLGLSVRTLQRRLLSLGTSFNRELDEARKQLAYRYLRQTDMRVSQIAFRLGFSAPSAFTRATHRWFGHRPSKVRGNPLGRND